MSIENGDLVRKLSEENSRLKLQLTRTSLKLYNIEAIVESARQTWVMRGSDEAIKQLVLDIKYGKTSSIYRTDTEK